MLASGRYAMLDDGMRFSLVPWRPVIEQRLGQQIAATVRGGGVSGKWTTAWAVPKLVRPDANDFTEWIQRAQPHPTGGH